MGRLAVDRLRGGARRPGVPRLPGRRAPVDAPGGAHRAGHRHHRPVGAGPGRGAQALRRRQPVRPPVPPGPGLRLGRLHRAGGAALPARDHPGRHGGALGVDPLHPCRPGHQRQRPQRAGGADAGLVPGPAGRAHLDPRRDARRLRRGARRPVHRPVGHHLHHRRHRRRARRRAARGVPVVPADARRRPDHRRGRVAGHALRQRHQRLAGPGPHHGAQPDAGLPRDLPGRGGPWPWPAAALARRRAAAAPRHRADQRPRPPAGRGRRPGAAVRGHGRVLGLRDLHVARHRRHGPVDRGDHRLRRADLPGPVGPRRHRRPHRRSLRARRHRHRAGHPARHPAHHPGGPRLRPAGAAHPWRQPGGRHPGSRVPGVRGGVRQPELPRRPPRRRHADRADHALRHRGRRLRPPARVGGREPHRASCSAGSWWPTCGDRPPVDGCSRCAPTSGPRRPSASRSSA